MKGIVFLLALFSTFYSCMPHQTKPIFKLIRHYPLDGVKSVSGMEISGGMMVFVSDNQTGIHYKMIPSFFSELEIQNVPKKSFLDSLPIIPKDIKKDFEAMTTIQIDNNPWLVLIGSGSKSPSREFIYLKKYGSEETDSILFESGPFYKQLQQIAGIGIEDFNLEGACNSKEELFLFNRGTNGMYRMDLADFIVMIKGGPIVKNIRYQELLLPELDGFKSGISGATYHSEKELILFTASVEKTSNWIDDGEILGSCIGYFSSQQAEDKINPITEWIKEEENILKLKVEAISISTDAKGNKVVYMATDNDSETCELIEYSMEWKMEN